MGYLLKEALKTLCGINQWAYAVFWKIGLQNPKLLIWEEYYYGPEPFPGLQRMPANENQPGSSQASQAGDQVHLLVNKMSMEHHFKFVGEGLIGRAAFTGSHQWIPSENFHGESYPPEVLEEIYEQFSAGIQTVAVIPVLPHGVLQFGSYFKIAENTGLLHEVASLVNQLSCHVPDVLLSDDNYSESRGCLNIGDMSREVDTMTTTLLITDRFLGQMSSSSNGVTIPEFASDTMMPYCLGDAPVNQLSSMSWGHENPNVAEPVYGFTGGDVKPAVSSYGAQARSGDDISDILGDFCNNFTSHAASRDMRNCEGTSFKCPSSSGVMYSKNTVDIGIFSSIWSDDHLLDAVVSKARPCPKEESSYSSVSLPYGGVSGISEYFAKAGGISSSTNDAGTVCSSIYEPSGQRGKTGNSKKPPEPNKATARKRLKPGENPRPRPKDRQMIQDRVKELREIVPNGAKCSIDSLLERTIKHLLFMQSVAKHADKLKRTAEPKIIREDGDLLYGDKFEGGATWAYEIGSSSTLCPIIVEDLKEPRQMLIEMLYEERGSFLEIAGVIRGLGLTILKGTMQARDDKIWSRFVVEANRDVTRMEIFIWLVRVLEQSPKKCDVDEKMKTIPQFHHRAAAAAASVITATGDLRGLP